MTIEELHEQVRAMAGDECFSTRVERTTFSTGETSDEFSLYVCSAGPSAQGWTDKHPTAKAALAELVGMLSPEMRLAQINAKIDALRAEAAALEAP